MVLSAQSTTKDYIRAEGDFHKRYIERTNKAEIRPEEQSEKAESCQENLWNEIQLKGHKDRKAQDKKLWASLAVYVKYVNRNITTRRRACGGVLPKDNVNDV